MSEVELYIMQFPPEIQRRLLNIRSIGLDVLSGAEEKIYHRVPTFMLNGKDVLNYGAYRDHITLYLGYSMVDFLRHVHPQYHYAKASMQLPHTDAFPSELIREICEILRVGHVF